VRRWAISSFSAFPLRISSGVGCIFSCAGFLYLLRVVYLALWTNVLVPGWASVVALECAFSGMILLALEVVGDHVSRTYEETRHRPLVCRDRLMQCSTTQYFTGTSRDRCGILAAGLICNERLWQFWFKSVIDVMSQPACRNAGIE
jgi:hypothetical protein